MNSEVLRMLREGQAAADRFYMNRNADRLAVFDDLLLALEHVVKAIEDMGIEFKEAMPAVNKILERARLCK